MSVPNVTIRIPGEPCAKGRPRFAAGRAYTPTATRRWEQLAAWHAKLQIKQPPLSGALAVRLQATFTIPVSWPKHRQQAAVRGEIPHISRPDADNLLKALDALNGIAWIDDAQIVSATVEKRYGAEAGVLVEVEPFPA